MAISGFNMFSRGRKLALMIAAGVYLVGAILVYIFIDDSAVEIAMSLPAATIVLLLLLSLVNYAVRGWRWLVFSEHLQLGVPAGHNAVYYVAGYSLTATPGKAGEAIRLWFLSSGYSVPYTRSLPMMVGDRIIDIWAVMLIVLFSMSGFAAYQWQSVVLTLLLVLGSLPVLFPSRMNGVLNLAYGLVPRGGRVLARLRRLVRSLSALSSLRTYGLTLVPTIIGWLAEGVSLYLLIRHFGADISFSSALFVFAFSMIVGAISMLPGGLGSTEATMVFLLTSLGMGLDSALAATAIFRIATFWFAVVLGLVCMPLAMNLVSRARELPKRVSSVSGVR